jgi:hypothetical protein
LASMRARMASMRRPNSSICSFVIRCLLTYDKI